MLCAPQREIWLNATFFGARRKFTLVGAQKKRGTQKTWAKVEDLKGRL